MPHSSAMYLFLQASQRHGLVMGTSMLMDVGSSTSLQASFFFFELVFTLT